ncbi:unnamed protein product [Hydatigera taeniaeformis]|uniref:Uncharacterized protein n=1 Tax=Hydatigena taeniaeformis TaxID=6205 RepID=A0A0R3WTK6_HYDTA|nr:unnamed protein product [Hydatigera taeniaeformis]
MEWRGGVVVLTLVFLVSGAQSLPVVNEGVAAVDANMTTTEQPPTADGPTSSVTVGVESEHTEESSHLLDGGGGVDVEGDKVSGGEIDVEGHDGIASGHEGGKGVDANDTDVTEGSASGGGRESANASAGGGGDERDVNDNNDHHEMEDADVGDDTDKFGSDMEVNGKEEVSEGVEDDGEGVNGKDGGYEGDSGEERGSDDRGDDEVNHNVDDRDGNEGLDNGGDKESREEKHESGRMLSGMAVEKAAVKGGLE